MKNAATSRPYQQGARAVAAEATGERILNAFLARIETQWFDEITLEAVARDAGVTVQTVIRRFGGKEALMGAAIGHFGQAVIRRRAAQPGDIRRIIAAVTEDYEVSGDMVVRLIAQEDRFPALKAAGDIGRAHHRAWLSTMFAAWLESLPDEPRTRRLDALVVATDLYVWKLLRRDMGRSVEAFQTLVESLIHAALESPRPTPETA